LRTRTRGKYNSNLASFYTFCDTSLLDPLAVGPIDIARYIVWLGQRGTLATKSLQPCLFAINRLLLDHALPPVSLGNLVTGVRKGLSSCQEDLQPRPRRMMLPAPVALAILELAERLLLTIHWEVEDPNLMLLRASAASIASYPFFNQGECSACALVEDLVIDDTHIILLL
jgi:hypothetical protein